MSNLFSYVCQSGKLNRCEQRVYNNFYIEILFIVIIVVRHIRRDKCREIVVDVIFNELSVVSRTLVLVYSKINRIKNSVNHAFVFRLSDNDDNG